ncbi:MAG: hypothetical protein OXS33_04835, partial [bacterium]|nr:hypothetical protein [bacterium]
MKHSALCFRPVSPGGVECVRCCAVLIINAGFGFPGRVEDIPHYEVRYQFGVWPWLGAFGIRGGVSIFCVFLVGDLRLNLADGRVVG